MEKITLSKIQKIAELARIELSEKEELLLHQQIDRILEYVDRLNEVNTEDVEATLQVTGLSNITRQDEFRPDQQLTPEDALANSPQKKDGYFLTNPVLT